MLYKLFYFSSICVYGEEKYISSSLEKEELYYSLCQEFTRANSMNVYTDERTQRLSFNTWAFSTL